VLFRSRYQQSIQTFFFIVLTLGATLGKGNTGNLFLPAHDIKKHSQSVNSPIFFKHQKWLPETINYYQKIQSDLALIKKLDCNLIYHFNFTMDAYLQVLSPFSQYQIAPYYTWAIMDNLRPDYNFNSKINDATDIVIFSTVDKKERDNYKIPKGFYVFSEYIVPPAIFLPANQNLLVLVPQTCK
jgi:hypothetical protein